jgi:hypothetical protein
MEAARIHTEDVNLCHSELLKKIKSRFNDCSIHIYYILSSNKGIFVWPIWPEVTVHIFTPRENNRLLDYYKIISISRPILARANMGLDFVSGHYGCLISRCRKYVINSLIHGHFHIGLVIIPQYIGPRLRLGPIWGSRDDNQANMEMPMY